ncbi:hypothetical protein BBJ41_00760 [Burkholderia stabilis]|uniref:HNH endonuclease n=1 Tax=Burkholderia TaxID=32008 RepID=UPI000851E3E9|nr:MULTISPECIES: HNH endonuclease [Burkholderia]AOR66196.1 hypothetical protein BBJ41_00760 [Burkholderia stabilis]PRE86679.1 HNH endonuclease [Burkholderia gladioli]PRG48036.1 HNH endonuclease [Burkholderia multivorans]HDR9491997.1 HNH endonuclease [Burkholderia stabilis]HDR9523969.1 HNH endonuclease [Burkholderia stabilis]
MERNAQRINDFLIDTLGLFMTNRTWSWDAYTDEWPSSGQAQAVVMKLWSKRLITAEDGTEMIEVWAPPPWVKPATAARRERQKNIARIQFGSPVYAVLRHGEGSDNTQPYLYDASVLYKLNRVVTDASGFEFAVVERRVPVDEFIALYSENARPGLAQDLDDIDARYPAPDQTTTRQALVQARMGQGRYRADLLAQWGGACAVTGCSVGTLLVASHAMAWVDADDDQRLDPANGLPLIANLDRLFDNHLIAFDPDTGDMLVSDVLSAKDRALVGVPAPLRKKPTKRQAVYLRHHLDLFIAAQEGTEG